MTKHNPKKPLISLDTPIGDFGTFLQQNNNKRLFFSARFGMGKTYFLQQFFKNNKDYDSYHLFPVRYQLARNEDILQLLKYDLLVELFRKYPKAFDSDQNDQKVVRNFSIDYSVPEKFIHSAITLLVTLVGGKDPLQKILTKLRQTPVKQGWLSNSNLYQNYCKHMLAALKQKQDAEKKLSDLQQSFEGLKGSYKTILWHQLFLEVMSVYVQYHDFDRA